MLVLEPLLLGVLLEPLLLGVLLEPLLLGVLLLGVLLLGVLLLGVLLLGVLLLGVLPPPVLEPDLLKCASHSAFDTCPSPSLSTAVKLGAAALLELAPPEAPEAPLALLPEELGAELDPDALGVELEPEELGEELDPDAPLELLPLALGVDLSLEDELVLCAMDTLASANSAAAVAVVISFNFIW